MTTWLAALGLIAVPIIIHIFNRTRYRRVDWAAMEFLLNAYRKTRKRMRLENILLLLLRVLAMLFLAFAFFPDGVAFAAKWLLDETGISLTAGTAASKPQHLVLVLDDTASMRYRDTGRTRSNFEAGIEAANDLLSKLNDNRDRVTLIRVSSVQSQEDDSESDRDLAKRLNREIPVLDVRKARELLGQARPGYGSGSLFPALKEAGRRIAAMDGDREVPRLSVVSDMQANAWSFAEQGDPQYQAFVNLMKNIGAEFEIHNVAVSMHIVGSNRTKNRGITDISLEDPIVGVGIPNSLNVTLGNFGSGDEWPREFKLQYRIDQGEERAFSETVIVPAGEERTVSQEIPAFQSSGSHSVQVEIVEQDFLEDDDVRSITFDVVDAVKILVVNGDPDDNFSKDEVSLFKLMLDFSSWYSADERSRLTPNRVSVVTERALSTTDMSEYNIIVLCNVGRLTQEFVDSLYDYLETEGGSLIFVLGDNVNADDYNTHFWRDGQGLLPAKLGKIQGDLTGSGQVELYSIRGTNLSPGTPFAQFDASENQRKLLEEPQIMRRWYEVSTPQELGLEGVPESRTLLSVLADQSPELMLDRPYARGYVAMLTTTIDGDWHELWTSAGGLPLWLFHELTRFCSGRESVGRNLTVGSHYVQVLSEREQTARGNVIENPLGASDKPIETTLADGRRRINYSRTAIPGIYRLKFLATDDANAEVVARTELFSVAIDGSEADVSRLGGTAKASGKPGEPQNVIRSAMSGVPVVFDLRTDEGESEIDHADKATKSDLWVLFIGLAMFCLFAEMGASWYFGRRAE